jgi:hypothetical protein
MDSKDNLEHRVTDASEIQYDINEWWPVYGGILMIKNAKQHGTEIHARDVLAALYHSLATVGLGFGLYYGIDALVSYLK